MKGKRKFCALLVSCAMLLSLMPTTVFAVDDEDTADAEQETEVQAADIVIAEDGTATIVAEESNEEAEPKENEAEAGQQEEAIPAEKVEEKTEDAEEEAESEVYTANAGSVKVKVTAPAGALPEDAELSVERYAEDSNEYKEAADAIGYEEDGGGMAALDISFISDGQEVEPGEAVKVSIDVSQILPSDADASTIEVQHIEESAFGLIKNATVVANESSETKGTIDEEEATAEFEVDSFSTFTVTWTSGEQGGPGQQQGNYSFILTVNTLDEEDNHLMDTNVEGVDMSRSSGEEFDLTAIHVDGYTFDYAVVVYNNVDYMNATNITVTIGNTANSRYTVAIDYEDGTYTNSSTISSITAYVYFVPTPSVTITAEGNDEGGYQLTAEAAHFGGTPVLIWEEDESNEGLAVITETDSGVSVVWATDDEGNVIAQAGDTVTVKVTAMYTDDDGTTQRATDTYVLTYGTVPITIRVSYSATTGGGPGGGQGTTTYYPEGADVTLLDSEGYILATGTTDANGYVTFDVIPGTYEVEAIYVNNSTAYMGDTTIEVTAEGENAFTLGMTSAASSVDHIDIGILATATLYINGKELTQEISINEFDFESADMVFQYSYSADGSTGYFDAKGFMDLSSTEESTGTDSDGNTVNQIRIDGTYPVGTYAEPVYYYLSLTKDVTFTDDETGQTYTVTMTFTSNFYYWDPANECPPLQNSTTWQQGGVVNGSGMDFVLTAASSDALVNVEKFVVDTDGNLMDAAGEQFTFELYLDHNYDGTDPHDDMEEYDEFTMTTSADGLGYYQGFVEVGHYYVVETDWPNQINGKNYLYTVVNIAYVGEEDEVWGERQTGSSIVSEEAVADANTTPVFIFNNVYGAEEPEKSVDVGDGTEVKIGDELTYTITYSNDTNETADVIITDPLDVGVDFVSASDGGVYDEDTHTVTWTISDVASGASGSVTLTVEVNENAIVLDEVTNTASVQVDSEPEVETNTVENPLQPEKEVDVGDGEEVAVGDELTYTISYHNGTDSAATITIIDKLDAGVDYVSSSPEGSYDAETHTVTWTLEDVEAYTVGHVELVVEVNENAKQDGGVENSASEIILGNEVETNTVTNPLKPDEPKDPEKSVDVGDGTEVGVGEELTYTITYYNNNNVAADVIITDKLDEGVDFVSATDGGVYDEDTHTVTWTLENVAAFTEGSVDLTVKVNENAKVKTEVDNTASVQIDNEEAVDTNIVENPLGPDEPVDPGKSADVDTGARVAVGDEITYTITYYNNNNVPAEVIITDKLDDGVDFVSATDGGVYDEDTHTVTWILENVAAFTEGSVQLVVEVNENAKENSGVDNTASVQIDNEESVDTNTVEIPLEPDDPTDPEKSANVDTGALVAVGDEITYTITYYNNNNVPAEVIITDKLDDGVDFVSATDGGVYDEDTHTVTWTFENVAAFTEGSVQFTVVVNENAKVKAEVDNTASVQIDNEKEVDTNTVEIPLEPDEPKDPDKSADVEEGTRLGIGDEVTYTITYYNNNNVPANVIITDELDEGVDFVSATDDGVYDEDSHTVTWTFEDVPAFTESSVELVVKVNEKAQEAGTVNNKAYVKIGNAEEVETNTVEIPVRQYFPIDEEIVTDPDDMFNDHDTYVKDESVNEYNAIEIEMSTNLPIITPSDLASGQFMMYFHDKLDSELILDSEDEDSVDYTFTVYIGTRKIDHQYYTISTSPDDECTFHVDVDLTALFNDGEITEDDLQGTTPISIFFYADLEGTDLNGSYVSEVWYDVYDGDNFEYTSNHDYVEVYTYEIEISKVDENGESLEGAVFGIYSDENCETAVTRYGEPYRETSGEDGKVIFYGLAEGTYYVKELQAPVGYTLIEDPIEAVLGKNLNDSGYKYSTTVENTPEEDTTPKKSVGINDEDNIFIDDGEDVSVGDTLTYEIRYYNYSEDAATVTITDVLDNGLDFDKASDGGQYDEDTRTITWVIENVPASSWGSVTFTAVVNKEAIEEGEITNTVSVQVNDDEAIDSNTVVNPVPNTRDISGSKEWDDDNDKADARPDSITVNLYQNDELYKSATVTAADGWAWSWTGLPKYDENGDAYAYTINEDEVEYYIPTYYSDGNFNITNTFVGEEGAKTPTSGPEKGGDNPKTADMGSLGTWLALLVAAMACMLVGFRMRKRSQN